MELKAVKDANYWMEALQREDQKALGYFFDLHYKSLCYFACRLVQDDVEAEDIVSACFVKLWESERKVVTAESVKAFLYIACRNACFDYLKHLKVKSTVQEVYFKQLEQGEETILNNIIETEVLEMLVAEIELLPEKCREVFKMIYFGHKKTDEIAKQLDLSPKTVRNHKAKAIGLLKSAILKKGVSHTFFLAFLLFLDRR
ncbi:RNA polymerase sigma-70 factor [Pedobacter hiemivivus]|uniref:RNA polymerase sigma-70 factor n=1 Tax=Pedobacter hiemivivus TaxID=2530454 RepID=A0A4R0NH06_9SPHI|nr:RNA polymerase sigma-70 factor [Pedobacter hiemivivus]TCC99468.1 RNA polymerase sigma-70 factor [Pedobacter hiemivivus]TKC63687.1 RNA polymerase sigma-70 factor [Pedobacter hiemivivus]